MGVSWREYVEEKQKNLTAVARFKANDPEGSAERLPRTEAEERATLRAEYFRKSSVGRAQASKAQRRLIRDA